MDKVLCSIIIVNWKSYKFLVDCLQSIKEGTSCKYEVIVIDNFSSLEEQKLLTAISGIKLICNKKNLGFAAANNQGFKEAKGDFIFMLNPDTLVLGKAVDELVSFLLENDDIDAAAPKLYYSEKLDYHPSVKKFPSPFSQFVHMMPFSKIMRDWWSSFTFDLDKIQAVECVWGAAIMFKKRVFDIVGYLDDANFFIYTEEVDFCKRMNMHGLKLYYYPKTEVIHFGGKSQQKSSIQKNRLIWSSLINYFFKYYPRWMVFLSMYSIRIMLTLKVVLLKRDDLHDVIKVIDEKLKNEK